MMCFESREVRIAEMDFTHYLELSLPFRRVAFKKSYLYVGVKIGHQHPVVRKHQYPIIDRI